MGEGGFYENSEPLFERNAVACRPTGGGAAGGAWFALGDHLDRFGKIGCAAQSLHR